MESRKQIEEQASMWLARRDLGSFSEADHAALNAWLAASTANRVTYLRLEAGWAQAGRLTALAAGLPQDAVPPPGEWQQSPFFESQSDDLTPQGVESAAAELPQSVPLRRTQWLGRRLRWSSLAAMAATVLLAAGAISWMLWPRGEFYRTTVGGLEAVPTSDGSNITLNTDTGLFVAMTARERRVDLQKGEAFFEVAKDSARPFIVRTDAARIIAVGTKFSVRRDADEVRVVVTEGRVRVEPLRGGSSDPIVYVSAGEIAHAGKAGESVEKTTLQDAEAYLSWRHGFVVFHETPLRDAASEFNRYTTRKIVIGDPSIGDIRISGNFRSNNVESFARLLAGGRLVHLEQGDDRIVLSRP